MFKITESMIQNIPSQQLFININMSQLSTNENTWLKNICIGGIAIGTSYLAYQLYKQYFLKPKNKKQNKSDKQTPKMNRKVKTQYSDYYFDKNLQIQALQETLPQNPTLQDIYLNAPIISRDQFIKYTRQIRKRRRLIRKVNQEKYIEEILIYENEIQDLLNRSRLELVQQLNIDPQQFTQMQQNYDAVQDLHVLHKKSERVLKQQLIKYNPVKMMSKAKIKTILDEQVAFVRTKMYERMKNNLQMEATLTQNQILAVVNALQSDIIYEKYGYQWEDIERKLQEGEVDTSERDKCQSILEADVVAFNYESLDSSHLDVESVGDQQLKRSLPTVGFSNDLKEKQDSGDEQIDDIL